MAKLQLDVEQFWKDDEATHLGQYRIMQDMPKYDILSTWISK